MTMERDKEPVRAGERLSTRDLASPSHRAADAIGTPAPEARDCSDRSDAETAATSAAAGTPSAKSQGADPAEPLNGELATTQPPSGDTHGSGGLAASASTDVDSPDSENAVIRGSAMGTNTVPSTSDAGEPLVPSELSTTFQQRWEAIQTQFVDEPRGAVEEADGLVANLMQELAASFAREREQLEAQWDRGEDISTEDLRIALQRYRSFFQRLLST
jgi:hypothetical protein